MIPFSSQRGLGQDLATHLLNEHDNEMMEVADIRGAIAPDLHGAFAEWEAQAHALTRCQKYLYSLSINPDPKQDPLDREAYLDYIKRTEEKLGLTGQPRAIVFHSKYGREHCHVVWSRVDAENEKAIQLSFDREKLMEVTREFARDYGLNLPAGYNRDGKEGRGDQGEQITLYDMHQERSTGFSKEEHQEMVTDCWRMSDSPKAFVQALKEKGYMLATGKRPPSVRSREAAWTKSPKRQRRGRPYVLVDYYGGMHALPKLIADKDVRTKDVRDFLQKDYPPESLPSVEAARARIAKLRQAREGQSQKPEYYNEALAELKRAQEQRRTKLEKKISALRQAQHNARQKLMVKQKDMQQQYRNAYLTETKRVQDARAQYKPGRFAKAFGKVTGASMLRKALHKMQDRRRTKIYLKAKEKLKTQQHEERLALTRRQEMQRFNMLRNQRALTKLEKREFKSFEESMKRDTRLKDRGSRDHMPPIAPDKAQSKIKIQRYGRPRKRDNDHDRQR